MLQNQIKKDVERTFQTSAYFRDREVQRALGRVLLAYAQYEPQIGYVQGMNFIAAALLYHAGEVVGFWLFISVIEALNMKEIFRQGLPGVRIHDQALSSLGNKILPEIFSHFVNHSCLIVLGELRHKHRVFHDRVDHECYAQFYTAET